MNLHKKFCEFPPSPLENKNILIFTCSSCYCSLNKPDMNNLASPALIPLVLLLL